MGNQLVRSHLLRHGHGGLRKHFLVNKHVHDRTFGDVCYVVSLAALVLPFESEAMMATKKAFPPYVQGAVWISRVVS